MVMVVDQTFQPPSALTETVDVRRLFVGLVAYHLGSHPPVTGKQKRRHASKALSHSQASTARQECPGGQAVTLEHHERMRAGVRTPVGPPPPKESHSSLCVFLIAQRPKA